MPKVTIEFEVNDYTYHKLYGLCKGSGETLGDHAVKLLYEELIEKMKKDGDNEARNACENP